MSHQHSLEFKNIIAKYKKSMIYDRTAKLDSYTRMKMAMNDENIKVQRKSEIEEDASEYDEIVYNGLPYRKAYRTLKYENEIRDSSYYQKTNFLQKSRRKSSLAGFNNNNNNNSIDMDLNESNSNISEEEKEYKSRFITNNNKSDNKARLKRKQTSTFISTKIDKISEPPKIRNYTLLVKDEDILPMIERAKDNVYKLNRNASVISIITDKNNLNNMKRHLVNVVEKAINQSTINTTNNNSTLLLNHSESATLILPSQRKNSNRSIQSQSTLSSPIKEKYQLHSNNNNISTIKLNTNNNHQDKIEIQINNLLDDQHTKHIINKINKQVTTDQVIKQINEVQKKLIQKSKEKIKTFMRYREDSEELRRRYVYIFKNKFV